MKKAVFSLLLPCYRVQSVKKNPLQFNYLYVIGYC